MHYRETKGSCKEVFQNCFTLISTMHCLAWSLSVLTLIIALDVILNSVALSLIPLSLLIASVGSWITSRSLSARCNAVPCLVISSLQIPRSSSLLVRICRVACSSVRSTSVGSSSSSSSKLKQNQTYSHYDREHWIIVTLTLVSSVLQSQTKHGPSYSEYKQSKC